jgi:hypothetical protein
MTLPAGRSRAEAGAFSQKLGRTWTTQGTFAPRTPLAALLSARWRALEQASCIRTCTFSILLGKGPFGGVLGQGPVCLLGVPFTWAVTRLGAAT